MQSYLNSYQTIQGKDELFVASSVFFFFQNLRKKWAKYSSHCSRVKVSKTNEGFGVVYHLGLNVTGLQR